MIKDMYKSFIKFVTHRLFVLSVVFLGLFILLFVRLYTIQIAEHEQHNKDFALKVIKTRETPSTRGTIYDRYGRPLAVDELAYTVYIDDSTEVDDKNKMIIDLINIIEKHDDNIVNEFIIVLNENNQIQYREGTSESTIKRFKELVFRKDTRDKELTEEELEMDALDMYIYLRDNQFNINEERTPDDEDYEDWLEIQEKYKEDNNEEEMPIYSREETIKIMSVRQVFDETRYHKYTQAALAVDISDETFAEIEENITLFPSVTIIQEPIRVYPEGEYFAHILGYTGKISAYQLEDMNEDLPEEEHYSLNDTVGKDGLEQSMEEYLRGIKGEEHIFVNSLGRIIEVIDSTEPQAGNDVYLTIDKDLQIDTYDALEQTISELQLNAISENGYNSKDIINSMLNNNVFDIKKLEKNPETDLEKDVYSKYEVTKEEELNAIEKELQGNGTVYNNLSEYRKESVDLIVSELRTANSNGDRIISISEDDRQAEADEANRNSTTSVLDDFANGKISLNQYLKHCISQGYMNLKMIGLEEDYYDSSEVYDHLVEYLIEMLSNSYDFTRIIYNLMTDNGIVSTNDWCVLLYEQNILPYDEEMVGKLSKNSINSYSFLIDKMTNLELTPAQIGIEPYQGSSVVADVHTGEVLAMVSYPSYDNNYLANGVDADYYWNLSTNEVTKPLIHRATQYNLAPGSTYKMVTGMAGLGEGVVDRYSTVYGSGSYTNSRVYSSIKCWVHPGSHGSVNVCSALEVSCNVYFNEVADRLSMITGKYDSERGLSTLYQYAAMFGLDEKTGIEVLESSPQISDADPHRSAIGQGTNAFTATHVTRYISTIANGGTVYDFTLINQVVDQNNNVIYSTEPSVNKEGEINQEHLSYIQEGMYDVINGARGTARTRFTDIPFEIAGKSGTAQEVQGKANHGWFVAYAPYDDPQIATTVVIPNGESGGAVTPVANASIKTYFGLNNETEYYSYDNILE